MIAQQNEFIQEAGNAIYRLTQEERIGQICEAREDYYRCQRGMQRIIEEQKVALAEKDTALAEKDAIIAALLAENKSS